MFVFKRHGLKYVPIILTILIFASLMTGAVSGFGLTNGVFVGYAEGSGGCERAFINHAEGFGYNEYAFVSHAEGLRSAGCNYTGQAEASGGAESASFARFEGLGDNESTLLNSADFSEYAVPETLRIDDSLQRGVDEEVVGVDEEVVEGGESVYLGGMPIGLNLQSSSPVCKDFVVIVTKEGTRTPALDAGIKKGDMLTELNGHKLNSVSDIGEALKNVSGAVSFKALRDGKLVEGSILPALDAATGAMKIGVIVKDGISGVGTVTFVKENGDVCTLGHRISDGDEASGYFSTGSFFECKILGVHKSSKGEPGALKGAFNPASTPIGKIDKNTDFGVYGNISDKNFYSGLRKILLDSSGVMPGKATVFTTLSGTEPKEYDVEIVTVSGQRSPAIKSMVIRVTDPELKDVAGGIVQGMSGSPVVQNGKLVGAVTHVFVNDPILGYGIYAEWLKAG